MQMGNLPGDVPGAFVLGHGEHNDAVAGHPQQEGEGMSHHNGHEAWVGLVGFPHLHWVIEGDTVSLEDGDVIQVVNAVKLLRHPREHPIGGGDVMFE